MRKRAQFRCVSTLKRALLVSHGSVVVVNVHQFRFFGQFEECSYNEGRMADTVEKMEQEDDCAFISCENIKIAYKKESL